MRSIVALIWVCSLATDTVHGEVFQCSDRQGTVWYTDRPCGAGQRVAIDPPVTVTPAQLTVEEQRILDRLALRETPVHVRSKAGEDRSEHVCRRAEAGLADLRRGYRASRAAELDARQRALEATVAAFC